MQLSGILLLTFRELWARKITIGLFLVSTFVWVMLAFALNLDIVDGTLAGIRIFGNNPGPTQTVPNPDTGEVVREALTLERIVIVVESVVAAAAYWMALLLGLFATASLLPGLLQRGQIDLLLSKPLSRTRLLAGHVLGVLLVVALLALYLLGAVWLVMSIKAGIWRFQFLLSLLVVVAMFGIMYSVMALVAVSTRSTALALIVSYGLIFASIILQLKDQISPQINPPWRQVFIGLYHVLPNVAEVSGTVAQLSGIDPVTSWYPLASSLVFGIIILGCTTLWFNRRDF